jgi:predicted amidophosphoribosyltransferase
MTPKCSLCSRRRKVDEIGLCKECREGLDPSERAYRGEMIREGLPFPSCSRCHRQRRLNEIGLCKDCWEQLEPSEQSYVEEAVREGLPITSCSRCDLKGKVDGDGMCEECREEITESFRGAMCSRCDIDLTYDGFCPNDRCPFNGCYQDESDGDWKAPNKKERRYIETVVKKRLAEQ